MFDDLLVVEGRARPDGVDSARFVVLVPCRDGQQTSSSSRVRLTTATVIRPNGVICPLLDVLVEHIRDVLPGDPASQILILRLLDQLDGVVRHGVQRRHDAAVLDGPRRADEGHEVGHPGHGQSQVRLWVDSPLVPQVDPVLPDDGEVRSVRVVKARGAHNGLDLALDAVAAHHTVGRAARHVGEVHRHVFLLNRLHVRVSRRDAAASEAKLGREPLAQAVVLDHLAHALAEVPRRHLVRLGASVEGAPGAVDGVLDGPGVGNEGAGIAPELVALLSSVLLGLAARVAGQHAEPDRSADKDVEVLGVWLHAWDRLDRGGARPDDGDAVVGPLRLLVVRRPLARVDDAATEGVDQAGDARPLGGWVSMQFRLARRWYKLGAHYEPGVGRKHRLRVARCGNGPQTREAPVLAAVGAG